jgi:cyclopropane fatty-acyl-phospholipid synthase-like methyltransferase
VADRVTSPVLDAGCGTGEHALFFAARGYQVTGIDFVGEAIRRAQRKADERGLAVRLLVKDATTLGDWGERFASVIDCGLFHVFSDDDRRRYVQGLAQVLQSGGCSCCASATRSRGRRSRGGCRARSCTTPSPTAGRSKPSGHARSK